METILNWIKPIIYFSIFITVMLHLLPGEKYTKYIRFFAGLLMIVLVMRPVLNLFGNGDFSEQIFSQDFYQEQSEEIALDIESMENNTAAYYESVIEESLKEQDRLIENEESVK